MNSSTLNQLVLSSNSTTGDSIAIDATQVNRAERITRNIENAIYAYIQAVRALGHTTVNTSQIAEALSLPLTVVEQALESLKKKGVKKLNV
jgi:hypothetical protein